MKHFLTAPEVADMIGIDNPRQFLRLRLLLEDEHQFPQPMPVPLRPRKWRADEIRAWISRNGRAIDAEHEPQPAPEPDPGRTEESTLTGSNIINLWKGRT